TERQ
ncbi:hypothetical protein D049_3482, partial [Vibrio parahaemolyticus VPTS-2010]